MSTKPGVIPRQPAPIVARFLIALQAIHGTDFVTAADVLASVDSPKDSQRCNELREALRAFVGIPASEATRWRPCDPQTLGWTLRRHIGVEAAGLAIYSRMCRKRKLKVWCVTTPAAAAILSGGRPFAPKPVRKPRPKKLALPKPPAPKPVIQQVVRLSPPGNARLAPVEALARQVGTGHVVRHTGRFHVDAPGRGAAERTAAALRLRFPGVTVTVTDSRGTSNPYADKPVPEPEHHRVPYLDPAGPPPPRRMFAWDPLKV